MILEKRIEVFNALGKYLSDYSQELLDVVKIASVKNKWFTEANCKRSILAISSEFLQTEKLKNWISKYNSDFETSDKVIGIVAAGNIPLVAFHDILSVLITGYSLKIKLSDKGSVLTSFLLKKLIEIAPVFSEKIEIVERLTDFDAVIATGSNNSARYFEYYFGKYPHIIRKNRNSVAVLNGEENKQDLIALADDIFAYFGLGCRNISKLYIPANYSFDLFNEAISDYKYLMDQYHYRNNLDYNRTLLMMNLVPMLDIDFINVVENEMIASPISNLHYQYYDSIESVKEDINKQRAAIQCVASSISDFDAIPFGTAQQPSLHDYADDVDTIDFLKQLF